ncbi:alpha-2-macroglobulin family protein [Moheibacter stercoris]|uniref:Uncharacterized protein YfaS (Alpha-2-macroglobulin family) n=1 Tax=Moheibacter stercoris TaxID=1628251 RepID=A0ABV2LVV1_9FLAO
MKKLFFLLFTLTFSLSMAQKKINYESKWKTIEKAESDGLQKSNLSLVNEIFDQAKKDKNTQQIVKSLLYQSKILLQTAEDEEETHLNIVQNFEKEIANAKVVNKAILNSLLAELYFNYYQVHQWEINDRTETAESTGADFRFWTESNFQKKSLELYRASLENPQELQNESIENWSYLLNSVKETQNLRPTLYDLLGHRYIQFLQTEDSYFYGSNYNQKESDEKREEMLKIYQDLIAFHTKANNQNAYLYNQMELYNLGTLDRNSPEFYAQIESLSKKFPNAEYTANVLFELAQLQLNKRYNTPDIDSKTYKIHTEEALATLKSIQVRFPKSLVIENVKSLEKEILAKTFNISIEKFIPTNVNTPFVVSHKNLNQLHFKILRFKTLEKDLVYEFNYASDKNKQAAFNAILKAFPTEKEFDLNLKSFDDYKEYSTVAKLDPLPEGRYLVLVSNDPDFQVGKENSTIMFQYLNVSNYAITFRESEFLVTERISGKPVPKVAVDVFQIKNRMNVEKVETITTNEFGMGKIGNSNNNYRNLEFAVKGESVRYSTYVYRQNEPAKKETTYSTKIFSDRSIYRPGQTIYFKAISYEENAKEDRKVLTHKKVTVSLYDVNSQKVSELQLTSNEFGSVSGEFILPNSGLTGNYRLQTSIDGVNNNYYANSHYFSVEEYKRPRFEVKFDDVKDIFKLEEEVTAKGTATAYSGANIDNTKVTYRVYRQKIYPYWPWWKRGYFPGNEPAEEIIHGETTTDADGKFVVKFPAKPAPDEQNPMRRGSSAENARTYTYRIEADVTDLNGETRSSQQSITVGDLRYTLDIPLAQNIDLAKLEEIPVDTRNLNGQFSEAKGQITLTKINPPERILRNSPLRETDYNLYSKEEFISYFPNEPYGKENQKENWAKESPVLNASFDTSKEKSVKIEPKNWKEGYYLLKAWIVDGKDSIPSEKLVYLYKTNKEQPIDKEIFAASLDKNEYKPGDKATLKFSSATENSEVLVQLEANGKIIKTEKIQLNNSTKSFSFPIEESYKGNVYVNYFFSKFNTAQQGQLTVNVPHEDKSLKITAGTIRNKLLPGQNETWELTVSGQGKEKFMSEVLATMYDASLDQFRSQSNSFPMFRSNNGTRFTVWNSYQSFGLIGFNQLSYDRNTYYYPQNELVFTDFNWFGFHWDRYINGNYGYFDEVIIGGIRMEAAAPVASAVASAEEITVDDALNGRVAGIQMREKSADSIANMISNLDPNSPNAEQTSFEEKLNNVQARKALQETAFFYPNIRTDENGNFKIQFTTPESLTSWKLMTTAHTPDMRTGYFETTVQTQKDLMVVPNPPRFLREGDQITFSSKVTNLSDKALSGQAKLLLFDAFTMQPVDVEFGNTNATKNINVEKGKSDEVSWTLNIPKTHQAIVYRVVASAGDFSDGEESVLPILTNRMMVTETLPIHVREGQNKTFRLDKLKNNTSKSLDNFKLTFEMTTNPIWYAVFSLPYLREYPYECSEQVFSRMYGNLISQHIINSNPKIKTVFDDWNAKGELKSKLEQNEELKALLLEETPWVRDAENEEEQMKRIAVLFDLNRMQNELQSAYNKLKNKQSSNGGFPWFEGGDESRYITTHIVSGLGHLKAMGIHPEEKLDVNLNSILDGAIRFIDNEMKKEYDRYLKNKDYEPSYYSGIQYLYARSYFLEKYPLDAKGNDIKNYFLKKFDQSKFDESLQTQAMMAMIYNRFDQKAKAQKILTSVKDHSIESDEMGMYWKSNVAGWYWYQAPIETQALLIEAFDEITTDVEAVESMKVWLLKNRQTNQLESTKATTEAVFALMSTGKDWMNAEEGISVKIGNSNLSFDKLRMTGSGYVKTSWNKEEIKPEMAEVNVQKTSPGVAWGALYWQYFEDLDKITTAHTGVKFRKELFLKKNSANGPVLTKITESTPIQIGDLVTVRLEIQTDREMEFIHIKDMRASGFEPTNVISTYKRQGRLGYYESTRDAATNFFIDYMPKGVYVFEYDVRANNAGNFSNGITSLQNMYAPELSAHSEGIRVQIK